MEHRIKANGAKEQEKLMTMHKALHPRDDVDRLYVSRKEGGTGFASIEDTVDASLKLLEDYIEKHEAGLITAIRKDTDNTRDNSMKINGNKWGKKNNSMGVLKRTMKNISHETSWKWLRKRNFKRETESLRIAAQDNAVRTNQIQVRIDKTQQNSICRLCCDRDETINHIKVNAAN